MASTHKTVLKWVSWLPLAVFVNQRVPVTVKRVDGRSMSPTFNPDSSSSRDFVLFERGPVLHAQWKPPLSRGDIVFLTSPTDPKTLLVKRVIAFEGDVVQTQQPYGDEQVKVPPNHVWVEGDEPLGRDSNSFGPVSFALVQGRATYILWPPSRFGAVPAAAETGDAWSVPRRLAAREKARAGRVQPSPTSSCPP